MEIAQLIRWMTARTRMGKRRLVWQWNEVLTTGDTKVERLKMAYL